MNRLETFLNSTTKANTFKLLDQGTVLYDSLKEGGSNGAPEFFQIFL